MIIRNHQTKEETPMFKTKFCAALVSLMWIAIPSLGHAEDQPVETQVVDAMNKLFGVHPGIRANHAKGIVAEGNFKASPEAQSLSKAILFDGSSIPATIRFSDSTGIPNIPDGSGDAAPQGLAIKFHLPDGSETDMVLASIKFFPISNAADFRDFFLALAASPPGAPKPTKFDTFLATHPAAGPALASAATPDSFADEEYNGINTFIFVNKAGVKQAVRYIATPEKLVHLDAATAAKQAPDFLVDDLPQRLAHGLVTFHLKAQLAAAGDKTNDATQAWPADRKVVDLGVLTITKVVPDSAEADKKLLFLPGALIEGIEQSDDPLIDQRDGAYAVSFSRRAQ
jgi:catalase